MLDKNGSIPHLSDLYSDGSKNIIYCDETEVLQSILTAGLVCRSLQMSVKMHISKRVKMGKNSLKAQDALTEGQDVTCLLLIAL